MSSFVLPDKNLIVLHYPVSFMIDRQKLCLLSSTHLWNKTKDKAKNPITMGSLKKWAKDENFNIYSDIF